MMAAKTHLPGHDMLSAILSSDVLVLRGNLVKFSQNVDVSLAFLHTVDCYLTKASPHDKFWGYQPERFLVGTKIYWVTP